MSADPYFASPVSHHPDAVVSDYDGSRPWFLRTIPGRTGSFIGHAIAGILIGGLGAILLLLSLYRARNLPPNKSFAEQHIPERDPWYLRLLGLVIMIGVPIGMIYDILDKEDGYDPTALTHCTIYACFFGVGVCAFYESKGRLPPDSHRKAMVFAWIIEGMIWTNHHGSLPPDVSLHILLGYINFAGAAIVTYSIYNTTSVAPYLAGWGLLVMQGAWLVTIGLYECCINITAHEVINYFALYLVFIFLTVVLTTVHLGPGYEPSNLPEMRGKFRALAPSDGSDDSTEVSDEEEEVSKFLA